MRRNALFAIGVAAALLAAASDASAIPAFARKYGVSCSLCHAPAPRLNAFGARFAANGFVMAKGEEPRDTIDTGDATLRLMKSIPLALRLDMFGTVTAPVRKENPSFDFQTPWGIKLLSGAELAHNISYYMYFFLTERGEVAGLEDAYIQFGDIAHTGVNLIAGQFQVSDPLFKRELRLEYEDYQPYRVRVGDARPDMTYDRGLMALFSPREGTDIVVMAVNGRGIDAAGDNRLYDQDNLKNFAGRFSQEIGPLRVGGFGYLGQERSDFVDDITVWGPDATLTLGPSIELNGQYLRRKDTNPFFAAVGTENIVDSAFGELIWHLNGPTEKWHATALYNWIKSDGQFTINGNVLQKYQTASAGLHYLAKRNVRFLGDVGYDLEQERTRFTVGAFLAW